MNIGTVIFVVLAGMCAISAMVLPGISGSTILLTFGLYMPVITGIKEFLHLNFEYFGLLCSLGIGIILGVFVTLRLIKRLLKVQKPDYLLRYRHDDRLTVRHCYRSYNA